MQFKDRLASLLKEKGVSQSELARAIGVSRQSISSWMVGRLKPRETQLRNLAEFFGASPAWLLYGTSPGSNGDSFPLENGEICIPLYDATASCGDLGMSSAEFPTLLKAISVDLDQIRKIAPGASLKSLSMIPVAGDSMEPTMHEGDCVVVDSSQKQIRADAIYVIDYAGSRMVKRIQVRPGSVLIISDNPKYPPFEIPRDDDSFNVVGRAYVHIGINKI